MSSCALKKDYSRHNFELADTDLLFRHFADAEKESVALAEAGVAQPAYDQCLKASHLFNLLDARGVISVSERASYIGRVRTLAKLCCAKPGWLARTNNTMPELLIELFSEEIPRAYAAAGR
jgi:glycyl-tRNA synthetase alpha chain